MVSKKEKANSLRRELMGVDGSGFLENLLHYHVKIKDTTLIAQTPFDRKRLRKYIDTNFEKGLYTVELDKNYRKSTGGAIKIQDDGRQEKNKAFSFVPIGYAKNSNVNGVYHCFVHDGNRIVRNGLEGLAGKVRKGDVKKVRYIFSGPNGSGKTYVAKSVLGKLKRDGVPVSYIDSNDVLRWYSATKGQKGLPDIITNALKTKMIILDESNKIHSPGDDLRSGTPKAIVHLIDKAEEKGIPLAIFYTGKPENFSKMAYDLQGRKGDDVRSKVARDLGSRLGTRVTAKVRGVDKKQTEHFVSNYLMRCEDIPINLSKNMAEVVKGISRYIPGGYDLRQFVGDIEAVLFNARHGGKENFGYGDVSEVLGFAEQGGTFREGIFSKEVFESVSEFTGVPLANIEKKGSSKGVPHARAITAWTLAENDWTHGEIADVLPVTRTTVTNSITKIKELIADTAKNPNKTDLVLKDLALKWKKNCSFAL